MAIVEKGEQGQGGRLTLNVLLPKVDNLSLDKVGGPGKEYWVLGTQYENDPDSSSPKRNTMEPGRWRIEVSPKSPTAEDLILNVLQTPIKTLTRDFACD